MAWPKFQNMYKLNLSYVYLTAFQEVYTRSINSDIEGIDKIWVASTHGGVAIFSNFNKFNIGHVYMCSALVYITLRGGWVPIASRQT